MSCQWLPRFYIEHAGVGVLEEGGVQGADGFVCIVFVDHEAHVNFAGALRDHADVDVANGLEVQQQQPVNQLLAR